MICYSKEDVFELKIGDCSVYLSPLTNEERIKIAELSTIKDGHEQTGLKSSIQILKFCLKGIKGFKLPNGEDFKLSFDAQGYPESKDIERMLNCDVATEVILASASLYNGNMKEVVDPNTGKKLEGVEFGYLGNEVPE